MSSSWLFRLLLLVVGLGMVLQGLAVTCSRNGAYGAGLAMYFCGLVLPYTVGIVHLFRSDLSARTRQCSLIISGLLPTVMYRMTDPLLLVGFDEQLHLRTLEDLLRGSPLFSPNALLPVSPNYPGLELLTLAVQRATNLPTIAAITVVVMLCRVVLVLAIYQLGSIMLGDMRLASLAVMFYAISPQFYFFNSQFAYQTLALSLAVAGLAMLAHAVRSTSHRWPRAGIAVICFTGSAVSHHLTNWVTLVVLWIWAAAAPRDTRRIVATTAALSTALAALWTVPVAPQIADYLGPVFQRAIAQILGRESRRAAMFVDATGVVTPTWERIVLVVYVLVCTAVGLAAGFAIMRNAVRRRSALLGLWGLACASYPAVFAARLAPKASEIGDRMTTFTFLPVAFGAALVLGGLLCRARNATRDAQRFRTRIGVALVLASSATYLGGVILGSGPDWQRLPGDYLVVADNRSMDPETLAAAAWSRDHLQPGTSIMADRVPATLLSSVARLWVKRLPRDGVEPAVLYFSQVWGPEQTRTVRVMHLQYLYVDARLSDAPPHQMHYFYAGETQSATQRLLQPEGLAKFAGVSGIAVVYQHGPISIYDVRGLQPDWQQKQEPGWVDDLQNHPRRDASLGLLVGGLLAWYFPAVSRGARRLFALAGGAGSAAAAIAIVVMVSAGMVAMGWHVGWQFTAGLVVLPSMVVIGRRIVRSNPAVDREGRRLSYLDLAAGATGLALAGIGVGLAVYSAWNTDVLETGRILLDVQRGIR